jgi:hypothetical protein
MPDWLKKRLGGNVGKKMNVLLASSEESLRELML